MGTEQYHEPPDELPPETRTYARLVTSLIEEAEAINWYEQRLSVEPDATARAIMRDAQEEEYKHFSQDLEFLLRRTPLWREIARGILFAEGDIIEVSEEVEETVIHGGGADQATHGDPSGSLGIGGLKGAGL